MPRPHSFEEVLRILFIEKLESDTRRNGTLVTWDIVDWTRHPYPSGRLGWWPTKFQTTWNGLRLTIDILEPCGLEISEVGSEAVHVIAGEDAGPTEPPGPILVAFRGLNRAIYEEVIWNKHLRGVMGGITFLRDQRKYEMMEALQ